MEQPAPAYQGDEPYVFVCYAHADKDGVYPEIAWLQEQGINVWYDQDIAGGSIWRADIAVSIQGASSLLYYMSRASTNSPHCSREVEYALAKDIHIVPVYLEDINLPPELDLVLNRVNALTRTDDNRYRKRLRDALGLATTLGTLPGPRAPRIETNSIAVLPLLNIDGSDQTTVFARGMMDSIIERLAGVPGLRVSSRGDALSVPDNATSTEVRRRLRVSYYLEGSVTVVGERIRVVIHVIESATGRQLQTRRFDRKRADFFDLQDEITRLAIASLRVALPEESITRAGATEVPADLDAYILYRRGIEELHKPTTRQTVEKALDWFDESLRIDADYAAAYAGKGLAYVSAYRLLGETDLIHEAERACAAALALDPNLNVVHTALGDLYRKTARSNDAERAYRSALEHNPNDAAALIGLAEVYAGRQRFAEAEEQFRRAIDLQPGNWRSYDSLGGFLFRYGRYGEAAEAYREVVTLDPDNIQGLSNLGTSLMLSGDFPGALPSFVRSIQVEPQAYAYANLGLLRYYMGDTEEAVGQLEKATALAPEDHVVWMNFGDALSAADQDDRAREAFVTAERLAISQLAVNRTDPETMIDLAWTRAKLDRIEDALALVRGALKVAPSDPYVHYTHGLVLARSGDRRGAITELERAADMGYPRAMLRAEPHLAGLRDEPGFALLLNARGP